ncbi:MAG: 5-formyltetrahydrofolate cyclo-ligase [Fibrobacter sp.]|nr:5-formyltetrahydrofolate cyclo-ligase [Fibrobacter sp.]
MAIRTRHLVAAKLRTMTPQALREESANIVRLITEWSVFQEAEVVAGFYPTHQEPQIKPLLQKIMAEKKLLLPKVLGNGLMDFHQVFTFDVLRSGAFGLMEPSLSAQPWLGSDPDIVLVPGMTFNNFGERVGKGGGYYDRYLAKSKNSIYVGLGFSVQMVAGNIPQHQYDVRMNYIVSPTEIFKV